MYDLESNLASAVQKAEYYDCFWARMGKKLDYAEVMRAHFIKDNIVRLAGRSGLKILDLGCGRGWMAPFLSQMGSVISVDFSPVGIQFAQENYGKYATFILSNANSTDLGLPIGSLFDVVVCSEVLEHVPAHLALLSQISGLLRPEGWCMLTTPNGNIWSRISRNPRYANVWQPVENWITPVQLRTLLRQVGFKVVRHEGGENLG